MRRLLNEAPKGFNYDVLGELTRATINATETCEPFAFDPYRPYYCPVCGEDAGAEGHISTILSLEYATGVTYDFVTWSHPECFERSIETDEPDRDLE
jgi:hypothetical protein